MDNAICTLRQRRFLRGSLTLTIDGYQLQSEYRQGLSRHVYRFDLEGLLPDPIRTRHVPIWRIVGAVLVFGASVMYMVMGIIGIAGTLEDSLGLFIVSGILMVLGAAASASAAKHAVNVVAFQGAAGQLVLWPDLPSKEEFDKFVTVMIERIQKAQDYELNLLQHLRRTEIINDWQYDQAMGLLRKGGPSQTP